MRLHCDIIVAIVLAALALFAFVPTVGADEFSAVEHQRQTIYHSPQKPGFTSWVGGWTMPDGSLMVSFTQATGPVEGRPQASKEVQNRLTWPPRGHAGYDMTGLDMRNVHLHSTDAGKSWRQVSADAFKSCMNGVTNEAQTALADGTVLRGVFGFYLPYDPDLPQTGFLQRSGDGTQTWGKPEVLIDAAKYSTWPRRIRVLRDGRVVVLAGVAQAPAGSQTRHEFSKVVEPALLVSSDQGRTWMGPLAAIPVDQRGGWTEEFDVAELGNGDLLCIFRRASDAKRWQSTLKKSDDTWIAQQAGPSVLPHSGQPELLATREGPILHVATSGIHWSNDKGQTWNMLDVPGTAYYPRSVQSKDGRIFVFGHVGGDDAYGKVDQSIVMDSFRLASHDIAITDRKSLTTDKLSCERIPLGEADDYKPCIAQLPSGELLLTAFHQHKRDGNKVMEQMLLFRSPDGGRTWTGPQLLDLLGREPYLTVLKNGTVFITGHLLANDVRNEWGYTTGFLHRSTDGGHTWQSMRIESEQIKPKASNHTTRNVLEMADGSLLLGVDYDGGGGPYFVWRSTDGGQTWDKSQKCEPKDFASQYGFFGGETWLWPARSGKIWALVRVDSNELPIKDRPIKAGNDQADHFILFSSADGGKTFDRIRDFGDYGEMYMSLLRLHDKRLLLTFTVRDLKPPLGVRAIPGTENNDGFEFDFAHDRLMLDTRTPVGTYQGGGFGPTVQLNDGTLVTSYSYRGEDAKSHLEVVRWRLTAKVSGVEAPQGLTATATNPLHPVLIRNEHGPLLRVIVAATDPTDVRLNAVSFQLDGTDHLGDLESLTLFSTGDKDEFSSATPLGEIAEPAKTITFRGQRALIAGTNVFWLSCRLKATANLSHRVSAVCTSIETTIGTLTPRETSPGVRQRIGVAIRRHKDDGVHTYRIPALATSSKGTLHCVYDMRRRMGRDLQEDIDIGLSRSTDGGQTWEPVRVIMDMGQYGGLPQEQNGCSDPGIIVDYKTGEIFCFAVWMNGKPGTHQWTGDGSEPGYEIGKSAQFLMVRSQDDGLTWSKPENLTRKLKQEAWWLFAPSPQQGIQLADGTLVMPSQGRDEQGKEFSTIMTSRDHGASWTVGTPAYSGGSECQAVQLGDGSLMLNMRNEHERFRAIATTRDLGKTWEPHATNRNTLIEPNCNGSLLRVDHEAAGAKKHVLLFANPHTQKGRTHHTLQVSFDDGRTWPQSHHILLDEGRGAGYPSLTRVDDQHVGIVYEGSQSHLVFEKLSLDEILKR